MDSYYMIRPLINKEIVLANMLSSLEFALNDGNKSTHLEATAQRPLTAFIQCTAPLNVAWLVD